MGTVKPSFQQKNHPRVSKDSVTPDSDIVRITLLAGAIIIVTIAIIGFTSYAITKQAAIQKVKTQDLVNVAELISGKIDSRIERAKEISRILAHDPLLVNWVSQGDPNGFEKNFALEKIHNLVAEFDYTNSYIVSAVTHHYWDETGRLLQTVSPADPGDEWFFTTLAAKEPVTVNFDFNRERNGTFVFVNALIGGVDHPLGITGVGMGLNQLSEYLKTFKHGDQSNLWLVDIQGKIYLSDAVEYNGEDLALVLPAKTREQIVDSLRSSAAQQHTLEYRNQDHRLMDLIVYPLKSTDWFLLFQIPRSESVGYLNSIRVHNVLASFVVLVAILFFFYFASSRLVNPYKKTRQLNQELEQKVSERTTELHEKNVKLTDSIRYAQRIQRSILPPARLMDEAFRDHFLVWQPRDTVGGDFYWVKKASSGYLAAVGDCTGHGVPGALMSMIAISALNRIVDNGEEEPSAILRQLNVLIKDTLKQGEDHNSLTDDGLDIGICHWDREYLTFAGARTALYVRDENLLQIIDGDRQSVGYTRTRPDYPFTDSVVQLDGTQRFYMTTDGYIDQNGGPKGHSFGKTQFTELIERYYAEPLSRQRELFIEELVEFMGDNPQRDDITLLAFGVLPERKERSR